MIIQMEEEAYMDIAATMKEAAMAIEAVNILQAQMLLIKEAINNKKELTIVEEDVCVNGVPSMMILKLLKERYDRAS